MTYPDPSKGSLLTRIRSIMFLLPSWFCPHTRMRVFFHKLRGVRIGKNVEIGYFCIIGQVYPNLITIEDDATISADTIILEHDNSAYYSRGHKGSVVIAPVTVKKNTFIGVKCVILPGVTIHERAVVGAGAVVTEDVPGGTIYAGIPARKIRDNTG